MIDIGVPEQESHEGHNELEEPIAERQQEQSDQDRDQAVHDPHPQFCVLEVGDEIYSHPNAHTHAQLGVGCTWCQYGATE